MAGLGFDSTATTAAASVALNSQNVSCQTDDSGAVYCVDLVSGNVWWPATGQSTGAAAAGTPKAAGTLIPGLSNTTLILVALGVIGIMAMSRS